MVTSPYRPTPVPQIDGSYFQQSNCVCAVTADMVDRATLGRIRTTGAGVRKASGDYIGGITYETAQGAAVRVSGNVVHLKVRYENPRSALRDGVAGGTAMGVSISCRITRYTDRRTNWFTGFHTVYANDYEWTTSCRCERHMPNGVAHGEYLVEDPGTTSVGFLWWSAELLYKAAEARTAAYGATGINLLIAPDTEGVTLTVRQAGAIRRDPATTARKVGSIARNQHKRVRQTVNGEDWQRDNGGTSNGWHEILLTATQQAQYGVQYGFVPGKRLLTAA